MTLLGASWLPPRGWSALFDRIPLVAWPVRTQLGARRNAMVASTALAQRRAERHAVEDYLDRVTPARPTREARSARVV